jgi:hypothetical protein
MPTAKLHPEATSTHVKNEPKPTRPYAAGTQNEAISKLRMSFVQAVEVDLLNLSVAARETSSPLTKRSQFCRHFVAIF